MPAANRYNPDQNSNEAKALNTQYNSELIARRARIAHTTAYYRGEMKKFIKTDNTQVDDNIILPFCKTVIDKSVAALMGTDDSGDVEGVQFEAVTTTQIATDTPQLDLDETWEANNKNRFLHNFFLSGALAGHWFIQVRPNEALAMDGSRTLPRFVNLNPANTSVFWREDDAEYVLWYRIEIGLAPNRRMQDFVREIDEQGNPTGRWLIYTYQEEGGKDSKDAKWVLQGEAVRWEYAIPPIIDGQNQPHPHAMSYYGADDLGVLPAINDYINWLVSNQGRIVKNQAFPVDVAVGWTPPDDFKVAPDMIINVPSDGDFKRIADGTNLANIQGLVQFLQRVFYNSGREVDPATVADKLGELTNFGLRIMYSDSLFKRQTKWLDAGRVLRTVSQLALVMMGHSGVRVKVTPPNPLPADPAEQTKALTTDVQVFGLSADTALLQRGYDPEQERQKRLMMQGETVMTQRAIGAGQAADQLRQVGRSLRQPANLPASVAPDLVEVES